MYGKASRKGLQRPFLTSVNSKDIYVRTSTEERTFHVRLPHIRILNACLDMAFRLLQGCSGVWTHGLLSRTLRSMSNLHRQATHLPFHLFTLTGENQIDSLVPGYSCPRADAIRNAYQSIPAWNEHLQENADLKARLDAVFGTAGRGDWASWCTSCIYYGFDVS